MMYKSAKRWWKNRDRELFQGVVRTMFLTLLAGIVILLAIQSFMAYFFARSAISTLDIQDRIWTVIRSFVSSALIMSVAFGFAVTKIVRLVSARVREREGARLAKELQFARDIQLGAVPRTFPPYPDRREFDIYATMRPAREVGGDFYDFFFARDGRLVFLVADVSGKGVPAALFMMRARSLLKSHILTGVPLATAVQLTNDALCEENVAGAFVTAWIAELNTNTGRVTYVDAGHNPPIRRHVPSRQAEYVRGTPGLFLGALPGVPYVEYKLQLSPGESIYLYTDGITEQVNEAMELFGEERLLDILSSTRATQQSLLDYVMRNVIRYRGGMEQSDDCTQLEVVWRGRPVRAIHEYVPTQEALGRASADLEADLGDLPYERKTEILMAADEIFVNIVRYSGAKKWSMTVDLLEYPKEVRIVLSDDGRPFDPLSVRNPDVTVPLEDRPAGGLGIFIVKKTMSYVSYIRRDERNMLTLVKTLEAPPELVELSDTPLLGRKIVSKLAGFGAAGVEFLGNVPSGRPYTA